MQVGCEYFGIFIDGPVLNDRGISTLYLGHLLEPAVEEIDLQIKGPALHILIEIIQIGIVVYVFVLGFPAVVFGYQL